MSCSDPPHRLAGTHKTDGTTCSLCPAQGMVLVPSLVHIRPLWRQEIGLVTDVQSNLLLASSSPTLFVRDSVRNRVTLSVKKLNIKAKLEKLPQNLLLLWCL